MMDKDLLLGIDFGSSSCKVTLININGTLLGEAKAEYPTYYAHPGWAEQEPSDWYPAMCLALARVRASGIDFNRIAAVAFDGSTHNAVLLDESMNPLRRTIMWTDQRSIDECSTLEQNFGEIIFTTAFQHPTPTWTLPQLLWLSKHEPEILRQTRHLLFIKDYVRFLVTDRALTDHIEAQGTLFYDMKQRCWSPDLVRLAGITIEILPELCKSTDIVGEVTHAASEATGIPVGTPVICGSSDSAVEDYGAGAIEPGDAIVKLATAGNVNVMTANAYPHHKTLTYSHIVPDMWYTVSATNAAAVCQHWFRDQFFKSEQKDGIDLGNKSFELMDRLASASPVGSNGVIFHPYLQGERCPYWDSKLRGSFTGLGMHSTRADFLRALLEGVAFSLRDCRRLIDELGLPMKRIFLIGGGARSILWSEIVCNVMNVPVSLPTPGDASFGAALLAGVGIGIFPDCRSAVRHCLKISRQIEPDPDSNTRYEKLFQVYRNIHDALAPIYKRTLS